MTFSDDPAVAKLLLIGDDYSAWRPDTAGIPPAIDAVNATALIPTVSAISSADLTIVFGIQNADVGLQLGGAVAQAVRDAPTAAVFAFPVAVSNGQAHALERLGLRVEYSGGRNNVAALVQPFEDYFRRYGVASVGWFGPEGDVDRLGRIPTGTPRGDAFAAIRASIGKGDVFALPYHVAHFQASHDELIAAIHGAVTEYRTTTESRVPEYLTGLRLSGEQALLDEISTLQAALTAKEHDAERLARFRLILGSLQGDPLEDLVAETLAIVLEPSGVTVENAAETFEEDFWLVRGEERVALVEVKGVNTGVKRAHINQVDNHREELGFDTGDVAGLLVINVHRGDGDLGRKMSEAVHPSIVAQLRRQNVLLLRTADLWSLLDRRLSGEAVYEHLLDAILGGGGWLEANSERLTRHVD